MAEELSFLIEDECLGDYYFKVEESQYTLVKKLKGVNYKDPNISYHTDFKSALLKVASLLTFKNCVNKKSITIKGYIREYEIIWKGIIAKFPEIIN